MLSRVALSDCHWTEYMTYDHWKTTEPEPFDEEPKGECDCCGRVRPLTRCWPFGMETFACDECRGVDE
jgi:hypothetical protein